MVRASFLGASLVVAAATALIGGCRTQASWQKALWEEGFIPLPTLAVMRLVEPDEKDPSKLKLTTKNALVGTLREARAEDFRRDAEPWTWREIPRLTGTELPVRLVGGAEKYVDKIGLTFDVQALLGIADVRVEFGPSRKLDLSRLWFLEVSPPKPGDFHVVLSPLITEFKPEPREKTFFLVTKVLGGDIAEKNDASVKVAAKFQDEKFPAKVDLGGGSSWEFSGHGVALGVQGLIMKRQFRSITFPEDSLPIAMGEKSYMIGEDRIVISRDASNALTLRWVGVPAIAVFAQEGIEPLRRVGSIPPNTSYVLAGDLKPEGGRLLALQLAPHGSGNSSILSGATYDLSFRTLDPVSLLTAFPQGVVPHALGTDIVDKAAWGKVIGEGALLDEFVQIHGGLLRIPPDANQATIARHDIVEAFVPVAASASEYDHVRVTRYDVRGQAGRLFKHDVYRSGAVRTVKMRLWAQTRSGALEDITPTGSFTSSVQSIAIPNDVDYLFVRAGVRHEKDATSMTGFHGGRRADVHELNWQAAFIAPMGEQCKLVMGEAVPDPAILPERRHAGLPDWTIRLLALPAQETEVELKAMQAHLTRKFDICGFSVKSVGNKVGWLIYSAPN